VALNPHAFGWCTVNEDDSLRYHCGTHDGLCDRPVWIDFGNPAGSQQVITLSD